MLLDLATLDWSDELLELFGVPRALLPDVRPSATHFGEGRLLGATLPVAALAGDQQASLYAHGSAKATFGTGAFVLVGTGGRPLDAAARARANRRRRHRATVCARGVDLHRGRGRAVAARRARCARRLRRERGARAFDRLHRRRLLRPRAHRARLTALGARRSRADLRDHTWNAARASRARDARVDRVPGARRRRRDARIVRRCCASTAERRRTAFSCSSSPTCSSFPSRSRPSRRRRRSVQPRSPESRSDDGRQDDVAALRRTSARYEPEADRSELVAGWRDALRRTLLSSRARRRARASPFLRGVRPRSSRPPTTRSNTSTSVIATRFSTVAPSAAPCPDDAEHQAVHRCLARPEPGRREEREHRDDRADGADAAEEDDREDAGIRAHGAQHEPEADAADDPREGVEDDKDQHRLATQRRQLVKAESLEHLRRKRLEDARMQ